MSGKVMGWVLDTDLPSTEKLVLVTLADYAREDGTSIYPSLETISRRTSLNRRTCQRTLTAIEERGYVVRVRGAGHQTTRYRLDVDRLASGGVEPPEGRSTTAQGRSTTASRGGLQPPNPYKEPPENRQGNHPPSPAAPVLRLSPPGPTRLPGVPGKGDPRVRPVIDAFAAEHARVMGTPYPVNGGKDGASIKRLPAAYTTEALLKAVKVYFRDPMNLRGMVNVAIFCGRVNVLLARRPQSQGGAVTQPSAPGVRLDRDYPPETAEERAETERRRALQRESYRKQGISEW